MRVMVMDVDWSKTLLSVIKTGKVYFGAKQTLKAIRDNEAQLVILASNCPEDIRTEVESSDVKVVYYPGVGVDLGTVCGKPFSVTSLTIVDEGSSGILAEVE
ncbi:MAG: 50S ribosomal protein L30e [Methermicoccaceae archaeon]